MVFVFLKLEGNTVRNRVWNFLIVHSEFDYSMKDIAKFSDISYTALKEIWKDNPIPDVIKADNDAAFGTHSTHERCIGRLALFTFSYEVLLH